MGHKTAKEQIAIVRQKYEAMRPYLNERSRRIWAATEARLLGYGGQKIVQEATGLSGTRIRRGVGGLATAETARGGIEGIRKTTRDKRLTNDRSRIIEPATRGHPETTLIWAA